jgi:hypothetical protein
MTIIKKIKNYLAKTIFKEELLDMKKEKELYQRAREGLSVVDLVREQLSPSFNRGLLNNDDDLLSQFVEKDAEMAFLTDVHNLAKNESLKTISDFIVRDKLWNIGTRAEDMVKVNFDRATINGIKLLLEEIDRLDGVYNTLNPSREDFDRHDIT